MKRDFTHESFEEFLKRSADGLRMKAPEKVWQNLSKELNKRKRRFIIGLGAAFLLIGSSIGYYVTSQASNDINASLQTSLNEKKAINTLPLADNENADKSNYNLTVQKSLTQTPGSETVLNDQSKKSSISINNTTATALSNTIDNSLPQITDQTAFNSNNDLSTDKFTQTIVDSYSEFDEQPKKSANSELKKNDLTSNLPLSIESVINSYKAKSKSGKIEKQFYFTPTISYRKLTENKSYIRSLDPAAMPANFPALNSSVNNNVTHKPDVGFEIGFAAKYPLSNKFKIRAGLQFNVNRYDVKAFNSSLAIAPIALNNGQSVNVVNTITGYSNVDGYKSNWLQNLSFQAALPVGLEYTFSNNDKVQLGIGGTVQPTYIIGDRAYLITMDYKSYTQVPWLIRRWNVNTALETFVKYKNWQFGPQVRYQLLSSFVSKYPIKENLFDYGLKIGVTLK